MGLNEHVVAKGESGLVDSFLGPILDAARQSSNSSQPVQIPAPGELFRLILQTAETLEENELTRKFLLFHGITLEPRDIKRPRDEQNRFQPLANMWTRVLRSAAEPPTILEALHLFNRKSVSEREARTLMRRRGMFRQEDQDLQLQLRYEVPGPADLVRFAVRHCFEPDILGRFRFNEERNPILDFYHQTAGINYPIFDGPLATTISQLYREDADIRQSINETAQRLGVAAPAAAEQVPGWLAGLYRRYQLPNPTWANAYWWAHWVWPSPTQGYQMFHRFRPDRRRNEEPDLTRPLDFSFTDLNLLLRGNDYPPYFRPYLAGITYALPGLRLITRLINTRKADKPRIVELFRKAGYSPQDADTITDAMFQATVEGNIRRIRSDTRSAVLRAYRVGTLTRQQALFRMGRLVFTDIDSLREYDQADDAGRLRMLGDTGFIQAELSLVDHDIATKLVEKAIASARRCYQAGRQTAGQVRAKLIRLGITDVRIDQYLTSWGLELDCPRREVTAERILKFAREGIIDVPEAARRLQNMGYGGGDITYLLAESSRLVASDLLKAQARSARDAQSRQRAQEQLVRQQQTELRRQQQALLKSGTRSEITKWYVRGLITGPQFLGRFAALGVLPLDAQADLAVAEQDRKEYLEKQKKKEQQRGQAQETQPEASGPALSAPGSEASGTGGVGPGVSAAPG